MKAARSLSELLNSWVVSPAFSAGFQDAVWRRIRSLEARLKRREPTHEKKAHPHRPPPDYPEQ